MTPEQMTNLVPEPKLAEWLLKIRARVMWTIRDAMPHDDRKQRIVQQWTIDGSRYFYIVLNVQPGRPATWAIGPELGIVGRAPAAFAAMDRWLAGDQAPAIALASEILANQRRAERAMAAAGNTVAGSPRDRAEIEESIAKICEVTDRQHSHDAIKLAELVHAQCHEQGPIPPLAAGQFNDEEIGMLRAAVTAVAQLAEREPPLIFGYKDDTQRRRWRALYDKIALMQEG